jgi:hypothetical protein
MAFLDRRANNVPRLERRHPGVGRWPRDEDDTPPCTVAPSDQGILVPLTEAGGAEPVV